MLIRLINRLRKKTEGSLEAFSQPGGNFKGACPKWIKKSLGGYFKMREIKWTLMGLNQRFDTT